MLNRINHETKNNRHLYGYNFKPLMGFLQGKNTNEYLQNMEALRMMHGEVPKLKNRAKSSSKLRGGDNTGEGEKGTNGNYLKQIN